MGKERPAPLGAIDGRIAIRRSGSIDNPEAVGRLLGAWKSHELRFAGRLPAFRGLSWQDLEETFQATAEALLPRSFKNEEHLRNALRLGMRNRALNAHRDRGRRRAILHENAPGMHALAAQRALAETPENATKLRLDRQIVVEFIAELDSMQTRVFSYELEGLKYRAIAPLLEMDVNEARRISRAVEQKRERFQLLYDSGRMCDFRASTIEALQRGESTSEELYRRAVAHIAHCTKCRDAHKTNAVRLRAAFQEHADALLLPAPALASGVRLREYFYRLLPTGVPGGADGIREGLVGVVASAGVGAKVAGTLAAAAIAAGSGIAASGALTHHSARRPAHHRAQAQHTAALRSGAGEEPPVRKTSAVGSSPSASATRNASRRARPRGARRAAQTGFDYLGVPSKANGPQRAQTARVAPSGTTARAPLGGHGAANEFSP